MPRRSPALSSAFHVIGALLVTTFPNGDPSHQFTDLRTYSIAPGTGVVIDLTIPQPSVYPFVDHSTSDANFCALTRSIVRLLPLLGNRLWHTPCWR